MWLVVVCLCYYYLGLIWINILFIAICSPFPLIKLWKIIECSWNFQRAVNDRVESVKVQHPLCGRTADCNPFLPLPSCKDLGTIFTLTAKRQMLLWSRTKKGKLPFPCGACGVMILRFLPKGKEKGILCWDVITDKAVCQALPESCNSKSIGPFKDILKPWIITVWTNCIAFLCYPSSKELRVV